MNATTLPQDIINYIYEFDSTKNENLKMVMEELDKRYHEYKDYTQREVYSLVYEWLRKQYKSKYVADILIEKEDAIYIFLHQMFPNEDEWYMHKGLYLIKVGLKILAPKEQINGIPEWLFSPIASAIAC